MNAPRDRWASVVRWVDIETSDLNSPIAGWNQGMIKEFVRDLHDGRKVARAIDHYPLMLKSVTGWFLDTVVVQLLTWLMTHSIVWIGK
jgi:hypothetical protein